MTDSRKLTDNELEQVTGGFVVPGESFSVGDYVKESGMAAEGSKTVYRIDTLNGNTATATMYEKKTSGVVTTTTDQNINLALMTKLDSKPGWVPAN